MIQSVNNKTIKDLVKLKNKKTRDEKGLFLVDGFHMVEEAKKAGLCDLVISTDESLEGQDKVLILLWKNYPIQKHHSLLWLYVIRRIIF